MSLVMNRLCTDDMSEVIQLIQHVCDENAESHTHLQRLSEFARPHVMRQLPWTLDLADDLKAFTGDFSEWVDSVKCRTLEFHNVPPLRAASPTPPPSRKPRVMMADLPKVIKCGFCKSKTTNGEFCEGCERMAKRLEVHPSQLGKSKTAKDFAETQHEARLRDAEIRRRVDPFATVNNYSTFAGITAKYSKNDL